MNETSQVIGLASNVDRGKEDLKIGNGSRNQKEGQIYDFQEGIQASASKVEFGHRFHVESK